MRFLDENIGKEDIAETIKTEEHIDIEEKKPISDKALVWGIIGLIVLFGMVFGITYFTKQEQAKTIEELHKLNLEGKLKPEQGYIHKGYSFVFADGLWWTQIQANNTLYNLPLHFGPKETENMPINGASNNVFLNATKVYITFNPLASEFKYVTLAVAETDQSLIKSFGIFPIAACDRNETDACKNRPIVTCNDIDKAVIYFLDAPESGVVFNGNCVIISGTGWEIVRAADKFLLRMYGLV